MPISKSNQGKRSRNHPRQPQAPPIRQEKWEPDGPCFIQHLPKDLLIEILSWLPAKTILTCKFVCKTWLLVISEPRFISLHHSRSAAGILIQVWGSPRNRNFARRLLFTQVDKCAGDSDNLVMEKMTFTTKNTAPVNVFEVANSCNGFICLCGTQVSSMIVCNPLLNEYITVLTTNNNKLGNLGGLGWSSVTNEYKLLRTFYRAPGERNTLEAEVYTIGSGVWRSIGKAPTDRVVLPFNAFLHGVLHFAPVYSTGSRLIHCFDFEREQFRALPPPSSDQLKLKFNIGSVTLGVWETCLTYCVSDVDATKFELWTMKEYGVGESWTKALVIENVYPREFLADSYEPILFLADGEILMVYNDRIIVRYNPKTKTFKKTKIIQTRLNSFQSVAYSPCFESLLRSFKGEEVRNMRGQENKLFGREVHDSAG
ncbi:PREDICTED: F-box protein At3g07870-like [Fragaria vesca subsp. vesca]|uniref:F-box protein At3g07870-like n=1 Tax=Fragaria vesca subsp. vesca TaxID=101020 RepID=UPI0002C3042B|nr:PREDICTED: F-box protein At3g07870-like [Fragaria vesca subsp. vesca]